jgi:NAD(P)-dependent dehydrogenase (short-subunit alcohol dehydrogenase family)
VNVNARKGEGGRLEGLVALVTGGTSGIGLAVVRRFVAEGARVAAVARHEREQVGEAGAEFVQADVSDAAQMADAIERAAEASGALDVVVLNAGIAEVDAPSLAEDRPEVLAELIRVNTIGALNALTALPPFLRDGASVIITSTAATSWAFPGYMAYAASKAPLRILCEHAAMKLGSRGIRVNTVSPGTILTEMQPADDPEASIASVATCLGRVGEPDDVAGVFVFLASDDSRYVTGTDIRADGGWLNGLTQAHADAVLAGLGVHPDQ